MTDEKPSKLRDNPYLSKEMREDAERRMTKQLEDERDGWRKRAESSERIMDHWIEWGRAKADALFKLKAQKYREDKAKIKGPTP